MASQCLQSTEELVALAVPGMADQFPMWCRRDPTTSRQTIWEQEEQEEQGEQEA